MDADTLWMVLKIIALPMTALLTFLTVNAITCRQWRKNKDEQYKVRGDDISKIFTELTKIGKSVARMEGKLNGQSSGIEFLEDD